MHSQRVADQMKLRDLLLKALADDPDSNVWRDRALREWAKVDARLGEEATDQWFDSLGESATWKETAERCVRKLIALDADHEAAMNRIDHSQQAHPGTW